MLCLRLRLRVLALQLLDLARHVCELRGEGHESELFVQVAAFESEGNFREALLLLVQQHETVFNLAPEAGLFGGPSGAVIRLLLVVELP